MNTMRMVLAGIQVVDSALVHDAIELARNCSSPFLFNHVMRSWLFGVLIAEGAQSAPDSEILAVSAVLHDLGLTERFAAQDRFEVDGANAARSFLKDRGIPTQHVQLVWDAIALHTTRSIALHKQPEVAVTHAGIAMDVIGAGLDLIPKDKVRGILAAFPRLSMKAELKACLCSLVRRKPETTYDNVLKDIGTRYVDGYAAPSFADLLENAPFAE
jgi:transposase-like protein